MRFIVQVRIEHDHPPDTEDTDACVEVVDVADLERHELSEATIGLSIDEAKQALAGIQETMATEHAAAALRAAASCCDCGRRYAHKDRRGLVVRSLYGTIRLANPRWWTCSCAGATRRTFTPLAALIPGRCTPELALVEAKLGAHMSYAAAGDLLGELFPTGRRIHRNEISRTIATIAGRLDAELAADKPCYIDPSEALPAGVPEMPLVVTADGGYVHSSNQTSRRDGWFQAVCGTVTTNEGTTRRFGFVPTIDEQPRARLRETLLAQGVRPDQLITFITDGADDLANLTDRMNLTAEYVLDWFHIAMRFKVLANTATNLTWTPDPEELEPDEQWCTAAVDQMRADIARAKWFLWHGNLHRCRQTLDDALGILECCDPTTNRDKAIDRLNELVGYLSTNQRRIPNYAERRRAGEPISSATAESAVNQIISKRMVKKQQMRWSPHGAHRLLQVRTRVLDHQLDNDIHRWHTTTPLTIAA